MDVGGCVKRVAVISANLGNFEKPVEHTQQSVDCDYHHFTDANFSPRLGAMTPRLQARIVKMFGWQMVPGYDFYIWVDSSCRLSHPDSVRWFLEQCKDVHMAFFKHPHRNTIQEEADYLKNRLGKDCVYIKPRYENELIDEQLAEIKSNKAFADTSLFASTAFIYRNSPRTHTTLKEWWYHTSRYHSIDQLSLPYVLFTQSGLTRIIPDNYLKSEYIEYVRNK
jgi:hypothetical protein